MCEPAHVQVEHLLAPASRQWGTKIFMRMLNVPNLTPAEFATVASAVRHRISELHQLEQSRQREMLELLPEETLSLKYLTQALEKIKVIETGLRALTM